MIPPFTSLTALHFLQNFLTWRSNSADQNQGNANKNGWVWIDDTPPHTYIIINMIVVFQWKQGILHGGAPFINGTDKWKSHPFKTFTIAWWTRLALLSHCNCHGKYLGWTDLKLCESPEPGIFREFTYQTESATSASGLPSCIGWALLSLLAWASFQFGLLKT